MQKIYLIDGMSIVFRAYYAMQNTRFTNKDNTPTGAILGFINILTSLLEQFSPEYIAVVFDRSEPTFRHKLYPEYKANRIKMPEDLAEQIPFIKSFVDLCGMKRIEKPGFEADDIIGTLAQYAKGNEIEVYCITSDKDFFQLVHDSIFILRNKRDSSDYEKIGAEGVVEKMGVLPSQVIDFLALTGDSSDNVPGVRGVGEKTALSLLEKYSSLNDIYENLETDETIKDSLRKKLVTDKEMAFLSKELVTIDTNVPLEITIDDLQLASADFTAIDDFFASLDFKQLRVKWKKRSEKYGNALVTQEKSLQDAVNSDIKYTIATQENIKNYLDKLENSSLISIHLDTVDSKSGVKQIIGIALAYTQNEALYIPISLQKENNVSKISLFDADKTSDESSDSYSKYERFDISDILKKLKNILENPNIKKCAYDLKNSMTLLKYHGINLAPATFDIMIAAYLLEPNERQTLTTISKKILNYNLLDSKSILGKNIDISDDSTLEKLCDIACEQVDISLKLQPKLAEKLAENNLEKINNDLEIPLIEVLSDMEYNGVKLDVNILEDINKEITSQITVLRTDIFDETQIEFNIDSPKQLGEVLFEKLQLPATKKTKTGYRTDFQSLSELAPAYPIISKILKYRQLVKLKSTYIDVLPTLINPITKKIHTTFNQAITSTGRLSSTDPNLQNIPIKTEIGREIRRAFVPSTPDAYLLSADYSQIELRVMAFLSQDENLISAFVEDADIHKATAAKLFEIDSDEVSTEMRQTAKTVNFGIMYGLGAFGLAQRLNISRQEASRIIKNYFERFPKIEEYMTETVKKVKSKSYAETLTGRRSYYPNINHSNHTIRTAAERAAINMPVQGTASDMIKIAMLKIYNSMKQNKLKSKMILQIHDELVFDVTPDETEIIANIVQTNMTNAFPLGEVPIVVNMNFGKSWFEAHS